MKDDWLANKMLRDAFRAGKKERKAQLAKAGQYFAMKWKIGVLSRKLTILEKLKILQG